VPDTSNIPEEVLDQIRRDLAEGDSIEEVAIRYAYDEELIQALAPKKRLNPKQEYSNDLEIIESALQSVQAQFNSDPTTTNKIYAITELVRNKREIIDSILDAENPLELFHELDKMVLNPLIKSLIQALTQPLQDLRSSLNRVVPEQVQPHLRDLINQTLRRQGEGIKDQYRGSRRNMAETLGIDPDAPLGDADEQITAGRGEST